MGTQLWGPSFWKTLHYACMYDTVTPEFVVSFANALPCAECRVHFHQILVATPFPGNEKNFEWSVDVHNQVNARLGKPTISVEKATELLTNQSNVSFVYLALALTILLTIFLFLRRR